MISDGLISDVDDLQAFSGKVAPLYDMLLSNRKEIIALIELRDTLLSKLMSGEFDVSSVEL